MTRIKEEAIRTIEKMPDDVLLDDIMAELYFKKKVATGLKELNDGKGISHKEVKKHFKKWLS